MKNKTLTIIGLLVVAAITFSFVYKPVETTKYEFMELSQSGRKVQISSSSGFSIRKSETDGEYLDFSFLMKVTEEYQSLGWEVVNVATVSPVTGSIISTILLKRAK